jgi:ribosomal protein S2
MEIDEPINVTIKQNTNREKTEQNRTATEKQKQALQKARQAKSIKKEALKLIQMKSLPETSSLTPAREENTDMNDYAKYIVPIVSVIGIGGIVLLMKKKTSLMTLKNTEEKQERFSTLELGF